MDIGDQASLYNMEAIVFDLMIVILWIYSGSWSWQDLRHVDANDEVYVQ